MELSINNNSYSDIASKKRKHDVISEDDEILTKEIFEEIFKLTVIPDNHKNDIYETLKTYFLLNKMSLKVIIESNWNEIPITPLAKRLLEKWVNDEIRDSPDNKRKCLINQNKSINDLKPDELNLLLLKPNNIEILWVQKKNIGSRSEWRNFDNAFRNKTIDIKEWKNNCQIVSEHVPANLLVSKNCPFPRLVSLPKDAHSVFVFVKEETIYIQGNEVKVQDGEADFNYFEFHSSSYDKKTSSYKDWTLCFYIKNEFGETIAALETHKFKVYCDLKAHPCTLYKIDPPSCVINKHQQFLFKGDFFIDKSLELFVDKKKIDYDIIGCGVIKTDLISFYPGSFRVKLTNGRYSSEKDIIFYGEDFKEVSFNQTQNEIKPQIIDITTPTDEEEKEVDKINPKEEILAKPERVALQKETEPLSKKNSNEDLKRKEKKKKEKKEKKQKKLKNQKKIEKENNKEEVNREDAQPQPFLNEEATTKNIGKEEKEENEENYENHENYDDNEFRMELEIDESYEEGNKEANTLITLPTEVSLEQSRDDKSFDTDYYVKKFLEHEQFIDKLLIRIKGNNKEEIYRSFIEAYKESIYSIKNTKHTLLFIGEKGQGKSEVINKLAAPKNWLQYYKIDKEIQTFPLISKKSGSSITQFPTRLCFQDQFFYQLIFFTEQEFNERCKIFPHLATEYQTPDSRLISIDNPKEIPDILKKLYSQYKDIKSQLILKEVIFYGPWDFGRNYELIDTPGYNINEVQGFNLIQLIKENTIIANVNSRVANITDLRFLARNYIKERFFPNDNTVFISFYCGDDEEDNEKDKFGFLQNEVNSKVLKNLLNNCAYDPAIPLLARNNKNTPECLQVRIKHFFDLSQKSMAFSKDHLEEEATRKSLFSKIYNTMFTKKYLMFFDLASILLSIVNLDMHKCLLEYETVKKNLKPSIAKIEFEKTELNSILNKNYIYNITQSYLKLQSNTDQFIRAGSFLLEEEFGKYMDKAQLLIFSWIKDLFLHFQSKNMKNIQFLLLKIAKLSIHNILKKDASKSLTNEFGKTMTKLKDVLNNRDQTISDSSKSMQCFNIFLDCEKSIINLTDHYKITVIETVEKIYNSLIQFHFLDLEDDVKQEVDSILKIVAAVQSDPEEIFQTPKKAFTQIIEVDFSSYTYYKINFENHVIAALIQQINLNLSKKKTPVVRNNDKQFPSLVIEENNYITGINNDNIIPIMQIFDQNNALKLFINPSIKDLILQYQAKIARKESKCADPIFILSWYEKKTDLNRLKFSFLDFKHLSRLVFVIVNNKQITNYQKHLQSLNLPNIILIQLPGTFFTPGFALNIAKLITEYFKFPRMWIMDHDLKEGSEWDLSSSIINSCPIERIVFGIGELLRESEKELLKNVCRNIFSISSDLIQSQDSFETRYEVLDIIRPLNAEPLIRSYSKEELEKFVQTFIKNEKIKFNCLKELNLLNNLGIISVNPRHKQYTDVMLTFPHFTQIQDCYNWNGNGFSSIEDKDLITNSRSLGGMVLYNMSSLKDIYFVDHLKRDWFTKWSDVQSKTRSMETFRSAIEDYHGFFAKKMTQQQIFLASQNIWAYEMN